MYSGSGSHSPGSAGAVSGGSYNLLHWQWHALLQNWVKSAVVQAVRAAVEEEEEEEAGAILAPWPAALNLLSWPGPVASSQWPAGKGEEEEQPRRGSSFPSSNSSSKPPGCLFAKTVPVQVGGKVGALLAAKRAGGQAGRQTG